MRIDRPGSSAFMLTLALVGCGGDAPAPPAAISEIVYTAAEVQSAPHFSLSAATATLGPGEDTPDLDLTNVTSAAVLGNGRVATFAAPGQLLLIDDSAGKGVRQVVRAGQGPGEFRGVVSFRAHAGDTLILADLPNRRISWFHDGIGAVPFA